MRSHSPTGRDLRQERLVGNWGGASEHIGRRWEEVGLEMLQARVAANSTWPCDGLRPRQIVPLAGNDSLQSALSRCGLPSPDVIMVLEGQNGERLLQALDFKWNLEFASYGQIRAEALQALLQRGVASLNALLSTTVGQVPENLPILDGLLSAPNLPVNHWFLGSEQNLRQEYPIETHEVIFDDVDPFRFFESLPGWELAVLLAQADRSTSRLQTLEGAEHYYRIGAGVLGAIAQLQVSIFVRRPPDIDAGTAFDWLRSRVRPPTSAGFVQHVEKLMATRGQMMARLRAATRCPYRFSDLAEALRSRGAPLPDREEGLTSQERERWGSLLRKVAAEHKELIYRTGLRLVQAGLSDAEALARLEGDSRRYAALARGHAERLIEAALQDGQQT